MEFFRFGRGGRDEFGQIGQGIVDLHGRFPFVKFRREMEKARNSRGRITGMGWSIQLSGMCFNVSERLFTRVRVILTLIRIYETGGAIFGLFNG